MKRFLLALSILAGFTSLFAAENAVVLDEKISESRHFTFSRPAVPVVYRGQYARVELFKYYPERKIWTTTGMILGQGKKVKVNLGQKGVYGLKAKPVLNGRRPAIRDREKPAVYVTVKNNQDDSVVSADGMEIEAIVGAEKTGAATYQTTNRAVLIKIARGVATDGEILTLWRQSNGQTPVRIGETDGRIRTFRLEDLPDGVHFFMVLKGEIPRKFKPNFLLVVDTVKPVVKVIGKFNRYYGSGETITFHYKVEDPNLDPESIAVQVKRFGEERYHVLKSGVPSKTKFSYANELASGVYSVKVSAKDKLGNYSEDELRGAFEVDTVAPRAEILGVLQAYTRNVSVTYGASDEGGSGLKRVEVWTSVDQGRTWQLIAIDKELKAVMEVEMPDADGGTTTFQEQKFSRPVQMPADEVGVAIVAVDNAGNRQEGPRPGQPPRYFFKKLLRAPQVRFAGFPKKQVYNGGEEVIIAFKPGQKKPASAVMELSVDDGRMWLPASQINVDEVKPIHWKIPSLRTNNARLRIVNRYPDGSEGIDISQRFVISSDAPAVALNEAAAFSKTAMAGGVEKTWPSAMQPSDNKNVVKKLSPENSFKEQMRLGEQAYEERKYALSSKYFKRATELRPDSYRAHFNLGRTYFRSNPGLSSEERDRANLASLNEFRKAIKINPAFDEAFNEIGVMYYEDLKFGKAAYYFKQAVKVKDQASYNYNAGLSLYKCEKYGEAKTYLARAIQLDPKQKEAFWYMAKVAKAMEANPRLVEEYWQKVADMYGPTSDQGIYALRQIRLIREGDERSVWTRSWLWVKELFYYNTL